MELLQQTCDYPIFPRSHVPCIYHVTAFRTLVTRSSTLSTVKEARVSCGAVSTAQQYGQFWADFRGLNAG